MTYVMLGLRVLIGVVFAVAAIGKVAGQNRFDDFALSVGRMGVLPGATVRPAAVVVVATEIFVATLMALPWRTSTIIGFGVAAVLLVAFSTGIVLAVRGGDAVLCRCFGRAAAPLGPRHVVRNAILVILALVGTVASAGAGRIEPGPAAITALGGLAVGAMITMYDDILDLFS